VLETEEEVHAGDTAFTGKAKIGLDTAVKTVLAKYPGAVIKIEYEIEPDGIAYEFDIQGKDGKVTEVEVNAITGKLGSPEEVLYQVGIVSQFSVLNAAPGQRFFCLRFLERLPGQVRTYH